MAGPPPAYFYAGAALVSCLGQKRRPNQLTCVCEAKTILILHSCSRYLMPTPLGCQVAASQHIGTLCILDYKPRHFPAEQYSVLANFAEMVTRELERNKVTGRIRSACTND